MDISMLRDYQLSVFNKAIDELNNNNSSVLGMCPSSGKTFTSLKIAEHHIINNKSCKVLILAHGQNVLKEQWKKEINNEKLKLSDEIKLKIQIDIPQGLKNKDKKGFSLIIIDEAHHFTQAEMVQSILKLNPTSKILYLTGTPSSLIKLGHKPICIAAEKIIPEGYMSDLYVGVVSTTAKIKYSDRQFSGDLTNEQEKLLVKSAKKDTERLLEEIFNRLRASMSKPYPNMSKWLKLTPSLGGLDKTIIACSCINQLEKIYQYLIKKGVSCLGSHSKGDLDSDNIKLFKDDVSIKVLLVVNRATLGFDMPNLVNVVDMTGTYNIDRIYQLYARVMRVNKENKEQKKYFFKLVPQDDMERGKFYMNASLCMMFEEFISKFNGKNLDEMSVFVRKVTQKRELESFQQEEIIQCDVNNNVENMDNSTTLYNDNTESLINNEGENLKSDISNCKYKPKKWDIDIGLFEKVTAYNVLKPLYNKSDEIFNEYAYVTIKDIRKREFGENVVNRYNSIKDLRAAMEKEILGKE